MQIEIWQNVKPVADRVLDVIKADTNAVIWNDVKQRICAITYRLNCKFTSAEIAVIEPLRDEIITNAVLSADEQENLIYWGGLARSHIETAWKEYHYETIVKQIIENCLDSSFFTWAEKGISQKTGLEILQRIVDRRKEALSG